MPPLKRGCLQLLLKLTVALGSLWTLYLVGQLNTAGDLGFIHMHRWLEYTDDDGGLEKLCNCSAIMRGEKEALEETKLLALTKDFHKKIQIPDEFYINETQDCRNFKLKRKYIPIPLSKEEANFPLAFSMVVHHKVQNFERLLRAIYAPQNIYCVHVDKKSKPSVTAAIQAIVSCFPNVFLVSQAVDVVYAGWPRVQADLNCMADLYSASTKWKYFINLCGQDFPLKTNLEMVRMLRSLRGSNSLESENIPAVKKRRISRVHKIVKGQIRITNKLKDPPPFNLPIKSGNAYIVVTRGFVRSVLENTQIRTLIEWFKDTFSPDEFLWATIQRMPSVPGSKWPNSKYDQSDVNALARLVKWHGHEGSWDSASAVYPECQGKHVREICVYGVGDVQWLLENHHLFANKFDTETDPFAVYCLERYLRHKALTESVRKVFHGIHQ